MSKYVYETKFHLVVPVNDYYKAAAYLKEDDMTQYLKFSIEYDGKKVKLEPEMIDFIEWDLQTEDSGVVRLIANRELNRFQLKYISNWVSGQNSDGLGEGFEQQDFAESYDEDDWGDPDPDSYMMASFDWQTNDYPFNLVSKNEARVRKMSRYMIEKRLSKRSPEGRRRFVASLMEKVRGKRPRSCRLVSEDEFSQAAPLVVNAPRGTYYVWKEGGDVYGSAEKPDPSQRIVNARAVINFTDQGFETIDDVVEYVKKYF